MPENARSGRAIYAATAVARMLGVDAETIAAWQSRFGLPSPAVSPGGQALYSRDDLERLRWVAQEVAAGREPGDPPPPNASVPGRGPQLLVLLAEREERAAELQEFFLRTEGYQVAATFDPDEALARAKAEHPDVALVELTLAGHRGTELCRRLRELGTTAVIAVSSLDTRDDALANGAAAFLLKPVDPLELVSTVKDLLGRSALLAVGTA